MRERAARLAVWSGIVLVLAVVVAWGAWSLTGSPAPRTALQQRGDYGVVPDFSLTERSGRTVTSRDLAGRFWVADFVFTRCTGVCPLLTARMSSLVHALRSERDMRFVSFSVDPEYDTPEVLSRYAAAQGADDERWLFVTGRHEALYRLIGEGFKLSVASQEPGQPQAGELITHSDRFVLVDPQGRIRGYYHGDDEETIGRLADDLAALRH